MDWSAVVLWIESGALFLRSSGPAQLLMTTRKVSICRLCDIRMVEGHMRTKHGKHVVCWSGFPLLMKHRFESS
jgi:hypothetical protein